MPSHVHYLANTTRSFRRFRQNYPVTRELMVQWVDNARVCASRANLQPLKYHIVNDSQTCQKVFPACAWAAYLNDWDGPEQGQHPTGYIVMCNDTTISPSELSHFDAGIAAQTIMLGAVEEGFGGCIILSFQKQTLKEALDIPDHLDPLLVLALGKPIEDVSLVEVENGNIKYYRDNQQRHFVPKRSLEEILF